MTLAQHRLNDGSLLQLEIKTDSYLGATTPDVTWINRIEKDGQKVQVGKIKQWLNEGTIRFSPLNDSLITVHYADSVRYSTADYIININQRIHPNDGSPYIESETPQNR